MQGVRTHKDSCLSRRNRSYLCMHTCVPHHKNVHHPLQAERKKYIAERHICDVIIIFISCLVFWGVLFADILVDCHYWLLTVVLLTHSSVKDIKKIIFMTQIFNESKKRDVYWSSSLDEDLQDGSWKVHAGACLSLCVCVCECESLFVCLFGLAGQRSWVHRRNMSIEWGFITLMALLSVNMDFYVIRQYFTCQTTLQLHINVCKWHITKLNQLASIECIFILPSWCCLDRDFHTSAQMKCAHMYYIASFLYCMSIQHRWSVRCITFKPRRIQKVPRRYT